MKGSIMSNQYKQIDEWFGETDELTEKQKSILAAAIDCFAEKGYASTSTSEIASKAGVAEGTIFRHYKTKKQLLLSVVSPVMAKILAPFVLRDLNKVAHTDYDSFESFLHHLVENRKQFVKENLPLLRILIQEIPFQPELFSEFKEHVVLKVMNRMTEVVEYFQEKGEIVQMPADTIIRLMASSILGYFFTQYILTPDGNWEDDKELERTIQVLLTGLKPEA